MTDNIVNPVDKSCGCLYYMQKCGDPYCPYKYNPQNLAAYTKNYTELSNKQHQLIKSLKYTTVILPIISK